MGLGMRPPWHLEHDRDEDVRQHWVWRPEKLSGGKTGFLVRMPGDLHSN